jgi:hypothetical protein
MVIVSLVFFVVEKPAVCHPSAHDGEEDKRKDHRDIDEPVDPPPVHGDVSWIVANASFGLDGCHRWGHAEEEERDGVHRDKQAPSELVNSHER